MAVSVNNYYIGKGIVSFKPDGGSWRDLGNVTEFEYTPEAENLEHYSSRSGIKTLDLTVNLTQSGTLRMVMEEYVLENLGMAAMGDVQTAASGYSYIDIFSKSQIFGEVKFVGTNDVGPKYQANFLRVDWNPVSPLSMISEEFATIEVTGKVASVAGAWGTIIDLATVSGSL